MYKAKQLGKKVACDKDGKVVLFEAPNPPLIGWIVCTVIGVLLPLGNLAGLVSFLASAFLFTWAYLELTDGTTYLRRLLGLIVLLGLCYSHLRL